MRHDLRTGFQRKRLCIRIQVLQSSGELGTNCTVREIVETFVFL